MKEKLTEGSAVGRALLWLICTLASIRVYMPWRNLGCLGFRIGDYYADFFVRPYVGMFYRKPGMHRGRRVRFL